MEYPLFLHVLEAFLGLLLVQGCWNLITSPIKHIPGPFWAKCTNLWRLLNVYTGHAEKTQRQLHDVLGPAVRLGPNMVSISDPDMINQVYSRKNLLRKSDFYAVNDLFVNGRRVQNVFSTRDEHMNTQVMKPIIKLFSLGNIMKMESRIDDTIEYFVDCLTKRFAGGANTAKLCDMDKWLHYCAWDVIGDITFSQRLGFLERGRDVQGMLKIGYSAMDYFSVVGMMPFLDLFLDKNPIYRLGPPFFGPQVAFSLARLAARRSGSDSHDKTTTPDFLDGFLDVRAANPDIVSEDTLLSYMMINVSAGSDTVATELRSIIYHLCKTPTALRRLQAELDAAKAPVPLSWAVAQTLPYLDACVKEGVRLMPGISLPLERVVGPEGLTLPAGGPFLPEGTVVGINPWVVNRDNAVFGADGGDFRPERWLRAEGESEAEHEARVSRMRASDLTFGAGKRMCAGRNLALVECFKIAGSLVRAFDIEWAHPEEEWRTTNRWFMRQSGMDVRLRTRDS